jgi:hypothetical protein
MRYENLLGHDKENNNGKPNVAVERLTLLNRICRSRTQISAQRPAILTEVFRSFPQSVQANVGILP